VQRPFRGLLSVHSRYGLHTRAATIYCGTHTEGFNHVVTSIVAPVASGWSDGRLGFSPTGKTPPFHGARQKLTLRPPLKTLVKFPIADTYSHILNQKKRHIVVIRGMLQETIIFPTKVTFNLMVV